VKTPTHCRGHELAGWVVFTPTIAVAQASLRRRVCLRLIGPGAAMARCMGCVPQWSRGSVRTVGLSPPECDFCVRLGVVCAGAFVVAAVAFL
jgi:hypothetical protein